MFLYASVMFRSLLFIFCFIFVFCYVSVLFPSVFLIFCFTFCFLLCFCYFSPVSYCLIFFVCFMLYSFHFSADFLLATEICNVLVVVSGFMCFSLCSFLFLTKKCCVCGRCLLCLICWFSVVFSMFPFCLQSCFCLICIMLKSDMWSSTFLLGFCLYVLLQYQVSLPGQSLEFANSVGFWVGKSGVSVPSLSRDFLSLMSAQLAFANRESILNKYRENESECFATWFSQLGMEASKSLDHPSHDVSSQLDSAGRTAMRHQAPLMTPFENPWTQGKCFPPNRLIWGTYHIEVVWPKAHNEGLQLAVGSLSGKCWLQRVSNKQMKPN